MFPLYCIPINVFVNNIEPERVAMGRQHIIQYFNSLLAFHTKRGILWRINFSGINKMYLGLFAKCPIF